jgi:SecD/SecF fusion protein
LQSRSYLFLLAVLALGVLSGLGYVYRKPNLGLDIQGGVRLTYKMDLSKLTVEQQKTLPAIQANVIRTILGRAVGPMAVVEPLVQAKGLDEVVVELPGYTDEEKAKDLLKTTASVEWYWAKTVETGTHSPRLYEVGEQVTINKSPVYTFRRRNSATDIKPGTPEYKQMIASWEMILKGDDLDHADAQPVGDNLIPTMKFSREGATKLERWTRQHQNDQPQLAAVLDDAVISIAPLKEHTVLRDSAQIDGTFDKEYVLSLKELLNSGSLPVSLDLTSSQKVDPTIGSQALDKIIVAGVIAFVVIAAFLIVYYALPGFVALIALGLYVLFTLTVMKWINATFSLAAISGFILSVGMAVDANILVFERFKEEMKSGKSLVTALDLGFKRALPAIFDSNACTILTSVVLANLGTGPVKGFASTLIIGVLISLFTAVTVTRSLLMFLVGSGFGSNEKFYALKRNWFGERFEDRADHEPMQVVNKSGRYFAISVISILVFLPFWFIGGLKPNVEFRGGYEIDLTAGSKSMSEIQDSLVKGGIVGGNVKFAGEGATRVAIVTVPLEVGKADPNASEAVATKVSEITGLQRPEKGGSAFVGPSVQAETVRNAVLGVLLSAGLIVVWLAFRFGVALGNFVVGLRFGMSAIIALIHDIFVVLGVTAVVGFFYGWEVSALFLTSMLTVIGFSVHDTVVIFDRIRENLRKPKPGEEFGHLVNRSISQSFARSINTSATVVVTLAILLLWGTATPDLKLFCVTMLAGIISGTYSSIYNASPILYLWDKAVIKRKGEAYSIMGIARAENVRARANQTVVETAPARAEVNTDTTGRSYGQVRRRASAVKNSKIELDD